MRILLGKDFGDELFSIRFCAFAPVLVFYNGFLGIFSCGLLRCCFGFLGIWSARHGFVRCGPRRVLAFTLPATFLVFSPACFFPMLVEF